MYYAGLDLHKRYFTLCVLTSAGEVGLDHRRLPADLEPLLSILRDLGGPVTVTVEATLQWAWLHHRLTQAGFTVCVAHPQRVKLISHARCKTDRIDAPEVGGAHAGAAPAHDLGAASDGPGRAQPGGLGRATAKPQEDIVWFSLPILEHIERHRRTGQAPMGPRGRREVHEHLQHAITELIEDEVRMALRRSSRTARHAFPDLLVRWIASTFVLVLNWWVESDSPLPAREADGLFRALIEPSLAEALR